jgi:hypothetical protein
MYHEPSWELDWSSYFNPYYNDTIILPEGLLLWRAYDTNMAPISSRPSQYSSKEVASSYASLPTKTLGAFFTRHRLRLLDIRFLTVLLQKLFEKKSGTPCIPSEALCIRAATISLGLCSATHQVKLMKQFYANDPENLSKTKQMEQTLKNNSFIETPGVRIKEPTVEGITMSFLKALFQHTYHGILSPPTNEDHSTIEIILFDPKNSGIEHVKEVPKNTSVRTMFDFTTGYRPLTTIDYAYTVSNIFITEYPTLEEFNERVTRRDAGTLRVIKQAEEVGWKWIRNLNRDIYSSEPPHPCVPVSIFTRGTLELN